MTLPPPPFSSSEPELTLRTPRLVLTPIRPSDVPDLWAFVSDPELPRHMIWEAHRSPTETISFVERSEAQLRAGEAFTWSIRESVGGALQGVVALTEVARCQGAWRVDRAELGYWVGPPFQNAGVCTEAAHAVVRFAFSALALHKVIVGCVTENLSSLRVIRKLGFRFVGEFREHVFRHGRWWDYHAFELLAGQYPVGASGVAAYSP